MANDATHVTPQMFPVAISTERSGNGTQTDIHANLPNRSGVANTKAVHKTNRLQVIARAAGAGICFLHSEKNRRAIRICVATVTIVVKMSATLEPLDTSTLIRL